MKTLWDLEENKVAINWDGTAPIISKDNALVKCLRWYCVSYVDEREEWVDYQDADGEFALFDKRQLRSFKRRFNNPT